MSLPSSALSEHLFYPETANGWRGVWHGQFGGVPYKYSGGLGTYPWQHNRIIAYSPLAQKTFFVIGSAAHETLGSTNVYESGRNQVDGTPLVNLRGNTLHTVIGYMDHRTGRVGRPHILSRKPGAYDDTDPHENPVLEIDKRGYLWVFIPSHGPDRKHSFIYRSALPGEIDAWVEVVGKENKLDPSDTLGAVGPEDVTKGANFSYPNPHYLPDEDAFLFLHTKYASWARRYTALSTGDIQPDMSVDWSNRKNLFEVEQGHYCVSGQRGSRVGMALNLHPQDTGLRGRTNLYYFELTGTNGIVKTILGETIPTPVTTRAALARGLIHDYEAEGRMVYLKQLLFTPEGHPMILYMTTTSDDPYAGGPRVWKTARWTGESWERRSITTSNHNYDHGSLIITQETDATEVWSLLAPTSDGPQSPATGGALVYWQSHDQGQTWQKIRSYFGINDWNHGFVRTSETVHPDATFIWADGDAFTPSASNIYLADREAAHVWRLPRYMAGKEAYLVPVEFQETAPIHNRIEAETLAADAVTTGSPPAGQEILGLIPDAASSGGVWLSFRAQSASGYTLQLPLPSLPSGEFTLTLHTKKSYARGQFQVRVNGDVVGGIQDGYVNQASLYETLDIGTFIQTASGPATLSIEVVGKNADATGYNVSLDRIEIHGTLPPQGFPEIPDPTIPEMVMDTQSPGTVIGGEWQPETISTEYIGPFYLHDGNADKGGKSVTWSWTPEQSGRVEVALLWNTGTLYKHDTAADRAHNVPILVIHNGNTFAYRVDQREGDGVWSPLDILSVVAGEGVQVRLSNDGTTETVVANGVRFRWLGEPPALEEAEKHLSAPQITEAGEVQLSIPVRMQHPLQRFPDLYWSDDLNIWTQSGIQTRIIFRDAQQGLLRTSLIPAPDISFWRLLYPEWE